MLRMSSRFLVSCSTADLKIENCSAKQTAKPTLRIPTTPSNKLVAMHSQVLCPTKHASGKPRCNPMPMQGWLLAILLRALEAKADLRVSAFVH
jgi:hypothetical protein